MKFPMHAILTMKTGICMGDFGKAHELTEWVTGHPVWTHEMISLRKEVESTLAKMFPRLPDTATKENWKRVLAEAIAEFGDELEVEQGHNQRTQGPVETLVELIGSDPS